MNTSQRIIGRLRELAAKSEGVKEFGEAKRVAQLLGIPRHVSLKNAKPGDGTRVAAIRDLKVKLGGKWYKSQPAERDWLAVAAKAKRRGAWQ